MRHGSTKHQIADYAGRRFGTRTVVGQGASRREGRGSSQQTWIMRCDCGRVDSVIASRVVRGHANACRSCSAGVAGGPAAHGWRGYGNVPGTAYNTWRAHADRRGIEWTVTIEMIDALYSEQGGRCALSGDTLHFFRGERHGRGNASLDRKDSAIGYIPGNVHLVTSAVNFAKQSLSVADFVALCGRVVATSSRVCRARSSAGWD